jgi:uncharacterized protein
MLIRVGAIEQMLREFFRTKAERFHAVYLFGSVARGTAGPTSDVDVAVLPAAPRRGTLDDLELDLEGELERLLGRTVQVVVLPGAPPDLVHRILRDGILVHEADRSERIAFEVRARNDYFDVLPVLDAYRRRAS